MKVKKSLNNPVIDKISFFDVPSSAASAILSKAMCVGMPIFLKPSGSALISMGGTPPAIACMPKVRSAVATPFVSPLDKAVIAF